MRPKIADFDSITWKRGIDQIFNTRAQTYLWNKLDRWTSSIEDRDYILGKFSQKMMEAPSPKDVRRLQDMEGRYLKKVLDLGA